MALGGSDTEKEISSKVVIEDPERLRMWITVILHPLCEADPEALTNYVFALIKKNKPEKELRESMSVQLDVFLQTETKNFVNQLFELLRSKEYLLKNPPPIVPKEEAVSVPAVSVPAVSLPAVSLPAVSLPEVSMPAKYNNDSTSSSQDSLVASSASNSVKDHSIDDDGLESVGDNSVDVDTTVFGNREEGKSSTSWSCWSAIKKDKKDDEQDRNRRLKRPRSQSPGRWPSTRLGRYRSRNRDRKYHPRKNWQRRSRFPIRNRSSSAGRNRSRSAPRYRRHGSRSRSRSPKSNRGRSRSQIATSSLIRDKGEKNESRLSTTINVDDRTNEIVLKEAVEKPSLQSLIIVKPNDKPEKVNRCRDFDEKGLCMRGELCPFDHGNDPVVLEDVAIPGVSTTAGRVNYNQQPQPITSSRYGVAASMMRPAVPLMGEYYPDNPAIGPNATWGSQFRPRGMGYDPMLRGRGGMMLRPMGPFPVHSHRDLINIPVVGMQGGVVMHQQHPMLFGMHPHSHYTRGMLMGRGRERGGFDHSRLGFKPSRNYANCSLEVKKIPREQNNIMDLNKHFQKFGKIVNIQINFESDREAALVTFSSPNEAQAAYRSKEAVFDNRFVRVFWHNKEEENEESVKAAPMSLPIKDRLGGHDIEETPEKILVFGNNVTKTVYNPAILESKQTDAAVEKIQAVEAIKKSQEMIASQESLKRNQEEIKRDAQKIISDLRKRKQDMLSEQLEQQKKLISKLESGKDTMKPEKKEELINLIKTIQFGIEKLKTDLEEAAPKIPTPMTPKSKEEAEREMLDAELELYNKEAEGEDTLALRRKISEFRTRAWVTSYRGGRGAFRGGFRGYRGRGRGGRQTLRALRTVDRRPTRVRVTGFPAARLPEILPHFSQFGTITEYESDSAIPSMIIKYKIRKSAEIAMINGKEFGESILEINWVIIGAPDNTQNSNNNNGDSTHQESLENGASIEDDEHGDILSNELALTYEEDEEEEDDRPSWRR